MKKTKLAKNLKYLSEAKKIGLTRLAHKVNLNVSTLHNYYQGITPKNLISLKKIADFFDITLDQLLFSEIHKEFHKEFKKEFQNDPEEENTDEIINCYEIIIRKKK